MPTSKFYKNYCQVFVSILCVCLQLIVFISPLFFSQSVKAEELKAEISENINDLTVENVTVEGNRLVPAEDILGVVKTRRGDRFDRDQVMQDLKAVNSMGYFDDKSLQVIPEMGGSGVLLKIRVQENAPVTQFAFQGNTVLSSGDLSQLFADQLGKPQNLTQLSQAIDKVERAYHEKGFMLARIVDVKDDPDGSVSINIDEGVINDVKIIGNKKTKDFIIRNAIKIKPGTVYNERQLTNDLRKLYGNGYFQDIKRSLTPSPDHPDKYTLKVEVDEKRTGSIGLGGGVDTIAGPFGSFSFSDSNFRGRGQIVSFNSQMGSGMFNQLSNTINNAGTTFLPNSKTYQFEASFIEPNIRGTNTSMAVSGFARNYGSMLIDESQQKTLGANITFTRPGRGHFSYSLGLLGENTALKDFGTLTGPNGFLTQQALKLGKAYDVASAQMAAQQIRNSQLKGGTYFSLSPTLYYDTRDSMFDPRKGSFGKVTAGPSIGINGASFAKLGASVSKFIPVGKTSTLAFNVQGGTGIGGMPQFAQYRLGGWNGLRGYRTFSDLGTGTGMLMASAELRMRLPLPKMSKSSRYGAFVNAVEKNVRAVTFFDVGRSYGNGLVNNFYQRASMGAAVGVGLRMNLPYVGLIRIDYGMPLISTALGKFTPRFTLGFGDKF
jgi:outer membrane protein insertion porin family